jgi:hypothetical protein
VTEPRTFSGIVEVDPETDPRTVAAVVRARQPSHLQFSRPLSDDLLRAMSEALQEAPGVRLRAYGRSVDPSLSWLRFFPEVQHLVVELWHVESFAELEPLSSLRSLGLGQTKSTRPSLGFLDGLPDLERLWVEGHARDFDAVGAVPHLRRLSLRVPKAKTLDALAGHSSLEVFAMDFGGIRDIKVLATLPSLKAVDLFQVRLFDSADLEALGDCHHLVALSLGALRNVDSLAALTRGPSDSLRFLTLESMRGLATLGDLAECRALEQLGLFGDCRPHDGRLDRVAANPSLRHLIAGDPYDDAQVAAAGARFQGETLWINGKAVTGTYPGPDIAVRWRRRVEDYLEL